MGICATPGCVALASVGDLCAVHAKGDLAFAPPPPSPPDPITEALEYFNRRYPRLLRLIRIEVQELDAPAALGFSIDPPSAALFVNPQLRSSPQFEVTGILAHQLAHLAQAVRRWRRKQVAITKPWFEGKDAFFPAEVVEVCRRIPEFQQRGPAVETMLPHVPPCADCGDRQKLEWVYAQNSPANWETLSGVRGWVAICEGCKQQLALFLTGQN